MLARSQRRGQVNNLRALIGRGSLASHVWDPPKPAVTHGEEARLMAADAGPTPKRSWTRWRSRGGRTRALGCLRASDACEVEWGRQESWGPRGNRLVASAHPALLSFWLVRVGLVAWLRVVENMAFIAYFCVAFYTVFYL